MQQNFGSMEASRLVDNIHLQPPPLDYRYYINDDNKEGDDVFHPTKSGPSDGQGHKISPPGAIPKVVLQSRQPPSLDQKYYINDDNKEGDNVFHPTKSGPSDGQGHKTSPPGVIPRVILQSLQPPSLDHRYLINDDNKDGDNVFHPTKPGLSDGQGHKTSPPRVIPRVILQSPQPPSLEHRYLIN